MTVSKFSRTFRTALVVASIGLLAACSQKAETLKLSVTQFGSAAEAAFEGYGTAYDAQFTPFAKSSLAHRSEFVANMAAFTGKVSASNIDILIDPDAAKIDPRVAQKWQETLSGLREQYQQFVAIFDNIEAGSAFGASAVTQSGPTLKKLRGQLTAITGDFANSPPQFLTKRSTLIAKLNEIRNDTHDDQEASTLRYQMWWQDWQSLIALEKQMQTDTLRKFVSANTLGNRLQNQIDNYAKLDVASLLNAVEQGISLAGEIDKMSPQELITQGTALAQTATN